MKGSISSLRRTGRWLVGLLLVWATGLSAGAQQLTEADLMATMNRAFALNADKKYQEALEQFLDVSRQTARQRTELEQQVYVQSSLMAGMCCAQLKQYHTGYLLARQLLTVRLSEKDRANAAYIYVYCGYLYACDLMLLHQADSAASSRAILTALQPEAQGEWKRRVASKVPLAWYFEGMRRQLAQQYDSAQVCLRQASRGFHATGQAAEEVRALCHMANIRYQLYDFSGALALYDEAWQVARGQTAQAALQLSVLKEQCQLNALLGNSEAQEQAFMRMDSVAAHTADRAVLFDYYNYKGQQAEAFGQLEMAELWYRKNDAFMTDSAALKKRGEDYIYHLRLRDLYVRQGKYDEALCQAQLCQQAYRRQTTDSGAAYFWPYLETVEIYRKMGDSTRCFALIDTLFAGIGRLKEPREIQELYTLRGRCHMAFKAYEAALADFRKADEVLATRYDVFDGDRVRLLPFMGGAEHKLQHHAAAEQLYARYAECVGRLYGEQSTDYVDALSYLANAEGFAGHIEAGCRHYADAVSRLKRMVCERMPYQSAAEREGTWRQASDLLTRMTPFALQAGQYQTAFTQACYDALVMLKSFLLESDRSAYDLVRQSGRPDLLTEYTRMAGLQSQLKLWEKDYAHHADSITAVTAQLERMGKHLAARCRALGDVSAFLSVDYEAVKRALRPGELLVDFTDFTSESQGRRYAAFLVSPEQDYPLLQALFAERSLDSLDLPRPDYYYEQPYAAEVLRRLWQPLAGKVREGATVYYVPSSLLFQVSLESLPLADGSLLGDHYRFVRLSSARELVRYRASLHMPVGASSAVLYGGLQYDVTPDSMVREARKYVLPRSLALRGGVCRGDSVFRPLWGTQLEIDSVAQILRQCHVGVKAYSGMEGTAESFVSMSGQAPQLLLVATHGFYYTPREARQYDYLRGYKDAMLLSGLVLSGGNAAWLGRDLPEGVMGGILTADDISRLDLSGLELVVLSACQTGQGRATAEGLYGLQRAFKKAGARTLVMTLWNVDDQVTREFVVRFHQLLATSQNGWNKESAFRQARAYIRQRYPEAFYWAAFVMLD